MYCPSLHKSREARCPKSSRSLFLGNKQCIGQLIQVNELPYATRRIVWKSWCQNRTLIPTTREWERGLNEYVKKKDTPANTTALSVQRVLPLTWNRCVVLEGKNSSPIILMENAVLLPAADWLTAWCILLGWPETELLKHHRSQSQKELTVKENHLGAI